MARIAREKREPQPLGCAGRCPAEIDAATRFERAAARNRSARGLEQDRRRVHRRAVGADRFARRRSLCPRAPTGVALRPRTNRQDRYAAKTEAALRWEDHP